MNHLLWNQLQSPQNCPYAEEQTPLETRPMFPLFTLFPLFSAPICKASFVCLTSHFSPWAIPRCLAWPQKENHIFSNRNLMQSLISPLHFILFNLPPPCLQLFLFFFPTPGHSSFIFGKEEAATKARSVLKSSSLRSGKMLLGKDPLSRMCGFHADLHPNGLTGDPQNCPSHRISTGTDSLNFKLRNAGKQWVHTSGFSVAPPSDSLHFFTLPLSHGNSPWPHLYQMGSAGCTQEDDHFLCL